MRFLVTGGAGFIGGHLVEHLVRAGHDVRVLDDLSTGRLENLRAVRDRVDFLLGSVTDVAMVRRAVADREFVLHQAARTSVVQSVEDPLSTHDVNVNGTLNLLLAARDARVRRVVLAASTAAYGDTPILPNREDTAPQPLSPYAASKLAGEAYCQAFAASYGLVTVMLRYYNVFGPRQDPASAYAAVVPIFISKALKHDSPIIFGDGEQTRDFTFVANVVHANLLACEAPAEKVSGQVFNVGTGTAVSVNDTWRRIQHLVGVRIPAKYQPARPGEVRHSRAAIARARECLGYEPVVDFETGMRLTTAFYAGPRRTPRPRLAPSLRA